VLKRLTLALAAVAALLLTTAAAADARDRNHDRIPDRWEKRHDLTLKVKQTKRDQDRDGMNNLAEFRARMDPHDGDSDHDGVGDEEENAGKVVSFAAGKLTIALFAGGEISGLVNDDTEIECDEDEGRGDHEHGDHEDGEHGDEHHGDGEHGDEEGDEDESGERAGASHGGGEDEECDTTALTPGALVEEAELKLTSRGAIWDEVELR
jgi:hypothetical protein